MLCLYTYLVRSKLDYGYIVYASAHMSYLLMLHRVNNMDLGHLEPLM